MVLNETTSSTDNHTSFASAFPSPAEYALTVAENHGVELDDFNPESVDDFTEGMVLATSRESHAELVEIMEIYEEDGRTYVCADYPERETTPVTQCEHLAESLINRIEADCGWVLVPYTATKSEELPYNCPACHKFGVVHEATTRPFAHGGCDSCGATFTHDQLVADGVAVELLV